MMGLCKYFGLWILECLVKTSYPRTGKTLGLRPETFTMMTVLRPESSSPERSMFS